MSASLNRVELIGNLGNDPEARSLGSGSRIVTMSVATSESWKDSGTGERKERTEWHRLVVWAEALGLNAEKYLKKGSKVYVAGQLRTRSYEGQDGITRYSTEVHLTPFNGTILFLDSKKGDGDRGDAGDNGNEWPTRQQQKQRTTRRSNRKAAETVGVGTGGFGGAGDLDDEIPF